MKRLIGWTGLCMILTAVACRQGNEFRRAEGDVWTTAYHVTYESRANLEDSICRILEAVDCSLSAFNEESLVSRINRNEPGVRADGMLREVMDESKRVNSLSSGRFDPTLGPLVDLWGFGRKEASATPVDPAAIDSIMQSVGISECAIDVHGNVTKKTSATQFDFSAIAKGYACDLIGRMFMRNGVENFLIEIGGEVVAHGVNGRGEPWRVLIESPVIASDSVASAGSGIVELHDEAIATSGSYRRTRIDGGKRISHILSAATGRPASTKIVEATVTAPSCMTADAIATACMAMPVADVLKMAERMRDVRIRLVVTDPHDNALSIIHLN